MTLSPSLSLSLSVYYLRDSRTLSLQKISSDEKQTTSIRLSFRLNFSYIRIIRWSPITQTRSSRDAEISWIEETRARVSAIEHRCKRRDVSQNANRVSAWLYDPVLETRNIFSKLFHPGLTTKYHLLDARVDPS